MERKVRPDILLNKLPQFLGWEVGFFERDTTVAMTENICVLDTLDEIVGRLLVDLVVYK